MKKFAQWVIKFRIPIILITVTITLFLGYHLKNLRINSDIISYLPQDDPLVILFNDVGDKFGGNSLAMVALEVEDAFNYSTLMRVNKITQKFKEMDEISHVMSLTDILDIKKTEYGLEVGKLIDKDNIPQDLEELKRIKEYTLSKNVYRGNLVSEDGRITVIIARLKEGIDKITTGRQMKKIVERFKGKEKIYYGGIPFQMIFLTDIIQSDLGKLIPLVVVLVMVILYVSFKTVRGIFLPLSCVLMSTVWTLGIMSLLKIPLTIASDAVPILLIAVGSAYGIHMLSKYNENVQAEDDKIQGIKDALSEVGIPILLAGITTLIGFLAFLSSNLSLIREFGIFTAIGVMFAMLISVTFLPAVLSFLKVKASRLNEKVKRKTYLTIFMDKLASFVLKNEKMILTISGVIVICSLIAIPHLRREVNMLDYFKKSSEIRRAEEMMENKLGGSIPVQLLVKGDIKDPFVLKEMVKFEKYLESLPDVNNPQSIADLICEMNRVMNGHYTIPETKEGVANLWFFIEGNEVLEQLINSEAKEGLIQAKLGTVDTKRVFVMVKRIEDYLKDNLRKNPIKIRISLASGKLLEELREERINQILSKISWDIKKWGVKSEIPETDLRNVISLGVKNQLQGPDNSSIDIIEKRIVNYFSSDEADVKIKSKRILSRITNKISKKLKGSNLKEEDVFSIIKKEIPQSLYSGDIEILNYTTESIMAIINEESKWSRVNQVIDNLKPYLPGNLINDREFLKDLRDDLWEINEDWIVVASSKYKSKSTEEEISLAVKQTGMPIIYRKIDRKIMRSQLLSLSIAIFLVFIILTFRLKSLVGGLTSISPIILTILFNFTLMAIFNIPLDVVTVMIGSVAVGIGIDYTIHFISRFKVEFARAKSELEALRKTLETTGEAIVINALSVMMGFLVLVLGSIVPMQRFGYMISLTMLISAFGAITLLPALILVSKAGFIGRFDRLANSLISKMRGRIKRR